MLFIVIFSEDLRKLTWVLLSRVCWIYYYYVPQGSILSSLLFDVNLCDLFLYEYSSDGTASYECVEIVMS